MHCHHCATQCPVFISGRDEMEYHDMDMKTRFSLLWTFILFNMIYADILGFMKPGFLEDVITGDVGGVQVTTGFLLIAAVMLEIPILMVLLSRFLKYRINRWANMIAAVITILFIIGGGSAAPHYIFFATIEVLALLLIIWSAWKWKNIEDIT